MLNTSNSIEHHFATLVSNNEKQSQTIFDARWKTFSADYHQTDGVAEKQESNFATISKENISPTIRHLRKVSNLPTLFLENLD